MTEPRDATTSGRRRRPASLLRWIEVQKRRIGACVRAHREERGLTRVVAAQAMGIHPIHLAKIELGRANIPLATLASIANAFNLELRAFFHSPPDDCHGWRGPAADRMNSSLVVDSRQFTADSSDRTRNSNSS